MLCDCPLLTGPFQLSFSKVQLAVYGEVEVTSQQPGEALPIAEGLSKSPGVVKNRVPGPLLSFPAGPSGPVDCPHPQTRVTSSQVLEVFRKSCVFHEIFLFLFTQLSRAYTIFQLSSSMEQVSVYEEVAMTSQDNALQSGKDQTCLVDVSSMPDVAKDGDAVLCRRTHRVRRVPWPVTWTSLLQLLCLS